MPFSAVLDHIWGTNVSFYEKNNMKCKPLSTSELAVLDSDSDSTLFSHNGPTSTLSSSSLGPWMSILDQNSFSRKEWQFLGYFTPKWVFSSSLWTTYIFCKFCSCHPEYSWPKFISPKMTILGIFFPQNEFLHQVLWLTYIFCSPWETFVLSCL